MTMSERVEILMGLVAPKARITWSGGPRGLLPHSLSVAATFTTLFVAHWAVLTYWLNPGRFLVHPSQWPKDDIPEAAMSWMVLVVCALGTIICLSGLLPLVWSRTREYRRTEYHVTSAGIFLAKGAHLVRYDLPEIEPTEKGGALSLGDLDWKAPTPEMRAVFEGLRELRRVGESSWKNVSRNAG